MVVLTTTTDKKYAGDGATATFSTVFTFAQNSEVKVSLSNDTTGVSVEWTEGTQYVLTGAGTGNAGSVAVETSPTDYTPATGETLVIEIDPAFTQPTPLPRGGTVSPKAVLEPMHDNRVRQILTLKKDTDRSIKAPVVDTTPNLNMPIANLRANKALAFDANGDVAVSTLDIDDIESGSVEAAASAAAALVSENNAASSASSASATLSDFETKYLGAKAADPTLDNAGGALIDGALYFDTTLDVMKVYSLGTTSWASYADSVVSFTNKTISDTSNFIHADAVHLKSRNVSGGPFVRGQVIYEGAYNLGQEAIEILLADADAPATMPAMGIVDEGILDNANGDIIKVGVISGDATDPLDTTGGGEAWAVKDDLYVSTTPGALTNVRPAGSTELVQAIASVLRVHATLGVIMVDGAGRVNDVPNSATYYRYSVRTHGAKGVGIGTDDTAAIQAAIDACSAAGGGVVYFPQTSSFYHYTSDIIVKPNVTLKGSGTYLKPNMGTSSNTASIIMQNQARLHGISTHSTTALFTGNMVQIGDGVVSTNQFNSPHFFDVSVSNNTNSGIASLGTGFALDPQHSPSVLPVTWIRAHDISFFGFAKGISMEPDADNWVNSNTFTGLKFWNCETSIFMDDSSGGDVTGNYFQGMSQSKAAHTTSALDVAGSFNTFEVLVWDWDDAFTVPWVHIAAVSLGNSFPRYAGPENIKDEGEGTIFGASVNSRMAVGTNSIIPMSFRIAGLNYEDNDLIGADSKFSVTISTAPDSNASAMFSKSGKVATTWNALSSTPVTIDIDLSGHADWSTTGSQLRGLGIVGDALPEEVILSAQLQSGGWVVLETLNFAVNHAVYLDAGYINGGPYNKLRITLTNPTAPAVVRIDQVFARFENSSQGASLPSIGGTVYGDVALEGLTTSTTQPAFLVQNSATDANVTGDGAIALVDFDTEIFDQDSNFSADIFTAPVAGRYAFEMQVRIDGATNTTLEQLYFNTSNRTYEIRKQDRTVGGGGTIILHLSVLADMDANDTAKVQVELTGIGADTADIFGGGSPLTFFSGHLVA